jgi:hypothetical protein
MGKTFGPIESVTLAGRRFSVAGDADGNKDLGGFSNDMQMNGDGTMRMVKTRIPALLEGITLDYDEDRGDLEYLQELRGGMELFDVSITECAGVIHSGSMQLTGDLKASTMNGTVPVTLTGVMEKQG